MKCLALITKVLSYRTVRYRLLTERPSWGIVRRPLYCCSLGTYLYSLGQRSDTSQWKGCTYPKSHRSFFLHYSSFPIPLWNDGR